MDSTGSYEQYKADYLKWYAHVAVAIEMAIDPTAQIAASEGLPLVLDPTTQRWKLAPPTIPTDPTSQLFPPDCLLRNPLLLRRAKSGNAKATNFLDEECARVNSS